MRHKKSGVKLNRSASHRKAMFRNMVTSLFKYDSIKTTDVKAKELRRWADSMITLAKRGDLHARRIAMTIIQEKDVVHKLFEHASSRYADKAGGYTRVTRLGLRAGDAASMCKVELLGEKPAVKEEEKPAKTAKPKAKKAAPKAEETAPAKESAAAVE
jgi:large subunit ribosomal protein L17